MARLKTFIPLEDTAQKYGLYVYLFAGPVAAASPSV
jgi:hypothetical protein